MKGLIHRSTPASVLGMLGLALLVSPAIVLAQEQSPQQELAAMEKCREQVISELSLADKMKMRSAIGAIQNNHQFIAANNAVTNAPTSKSKIEARKALARVKLNLIVRQDTSLKPVVEKIRAAQATLLK